jgi:virulence factor
MKIGIIGLGDIAQKAYLPVITTRSDVELVFCTRNAYTLNKLCKMYRVSKYAKTVDELLTMGIDAAFVHTSTESHVEIVEKLLLNNIHVYVDKPIAYNYDDALKLMKLSEKVGKILMVGFNRRFAPMYKNLKEQPNPNIIIMQKNSVYNPDNIRRFIFDDFIHVVDTLRFLSPGKTKDIQIQSLIKEEKLFSITLQLSGEGYTSIGIMNKDSGITEETIDYIAPGNKWEIRNLSETTHFNNDSEEEIRFKDWDPILYRRGFYQIIDHFLQCVQNNLMPSPSIRDSIITHEICEEIVQKLSESV